MAGAAECEDLSIRLDSVYSIARGHVMLAASGLALIILGFAVGYWIGYPHTVGERVSMWLSPWDNGVRGGDQIAHALWSLSTGGTTGTGLGLGDSQVVPAAHTDLIVSALGEQGGFLAILGLFLMYGVVVYRGMRIALRAPGADAFRARLDAQRCRTRQRVPPVHRQRALCGGNRWVGVHECGRCRRQWSTDRCAN